MTVEDGGGGGLQDRAHSDCTVQAWPPAAWGLNFFTDKFPRHWIECSLRKDLQSFQLIMDAFQGYPVVPDVLKGLGADLRKAGLGEVVL